jgi:hypothetical protein
MPRYDTGCGRPSFCTDGRRHAHGRARPWAAEFNIDPALAFSAIVMRVQVVLTMIHHAEFIELTFEQQMLQGA